MTKEFLPYDRALKLKQLGFDKPCFGLYEHGKLGYSFSTSQGIPTPISYRTNSEFVKHILTKEDCTAPTFSQAFRWFRDEHGVSVYVSPLEDGSAFYHMVYTNINVPYSNRICSLPSKWNTYEEAELECLDNLIEIVETKQQEKEDGTK